MREEGYEQSTRAIQLMVGRLSPLLLACSLMLPSSALARQTVRDETCTLGRCALMRSCERVAILQPKSDGVSPYVGLGKYTCNIYVTDMLSGVCLQ